MTATVHLNKPMFVRLEVEPWPASDMTGKIVATWRDGHWDVFEGPEGSDPGALLDHALDSGLLLSGSAGRDWVLIRELLERLVEDDKIHYR
ncbi:hypothetical protein [Azospirillum canadense]|uniref:hypothetical protein n=1 Tax=Azospirillum canadense TaxID=403962 RepID=UPI002227F1BD|nr:hypothetical protein [Azospirillum canadense]